jgi:hypothetical protein
MDALNKIGGVVTGKAGTGLLSGAGAIASLFGKLQQQRYLNNQINYQKMVQKTLSDPTALANRARAMTAPLNQGLVQGVGNEVQAYNAERGLSTSPALQAAVLSQALAPYVQQNQNAGMQAAISSLEGPIAARSLPGFGDNTLDLSELIKSLLKPEPVSIGANYPSQVPKPDNTPPIAPPDIQFPADLPPDLFPPLNPGVGGEGGGGDIDLSSILQFA